VSVAPPTRGQRSERGGDEDTASAARWASLRICADELALCVDLQADANVLAADDVDDLVFGQLGQVVHVLGAALTMANALVAHEALPSLRARLRDIDHDGEV
jgi:hypothetical protein